MQAAPSQPLKVFVAEDSTLIRERVAHLLGHAEMSVVGEGATPLDCIAGIRQTHPDVVVLDHHLEGGSGLEVLRAIHGTDPDVAFVVFSNDTACAYRKRYLAEGAVDFLDKATEFASLATAVREAGRRATAH